MEIHVINPVSQAWHITENYANINPFTKYDYVELHPSRKLIQEKGMSIGDTYFLNGTRYRVFSIIDPYPEENEWGRHYTMNVVFRKADLFSMIKHLFG